MEGHAWKFSGLLFSFFRLIWFTVQGCVNTSNVPKPLVLLKEDELILFNAHFMEHCKPLFIFQVILTIIKIYFSSVAAVKNNLCELVISYTVLYLCTRNSSNIHVKSCRLSKNLNGFSILTGIIYFNHLPLSLRNSPGSRFALSTYRRIAHPFYYVSYFLFKEISHFNSLICKPVLIDKTCCLFFK